MSITLLTGRKGSDTYSILGSVPIVCIVLNQPVQESEQLGRGGAECSQRSGVGVSHNVVEGRVQVEDVENLALVERIQDAIHPRQRLFVHFHKRVEALTIDSDAHSTIFLRNNHKMTSPRGRE